LPDLCLTSREHAHSSAPTPTVSREAPALSRARSPNYRKRSWRAMSKSSSAPTSLARRGGSSSYFASGRRDRSSTASRTQTPHTPGPDCATRRELVVHCARPLVRHRQGSALVVFVTNGDDHDEATTEAVHRPRGRGDNALPAAQRERSPREAAALRAFRRRGGCTGRGLSLGPKYSASLYREAPKNKQHRQR
jgi:hypothetical protein